MRTRPAPVDRRTLAQAYLEAISMTKSSIAVMAGILAASLVAACSDNTLAPTRNVSPNAANLAQDPEILSANSPRLLHTKQWQASNDAGNFKANGSNTGILFHGGPVLQSGTNVVAIYWSSSAIFTGGPTPPASGGACVDGSLVGTFLKHFAPSPYFNINSTYTDDAGNAIANAVHYTSCWANNADAPSGAQVVSDPEMQQMILSGFASGAISYNPNTLYAIFTSGAVNLGGGFGTQYCAYHFWFTAVINHVRQVVKYAAMPYAYAFPAACTMFAGKGAVLPPNGDPGADGEVTLLAHETEETTTDPEGSAWFDHKGFENADKCIWTFGATYTTNNGGTASMNLGGTNFLIQRNWVNAGNGGCALQLP
jgi:hypothetical protein